MQVAFELLDIVQCQTHRLTTYSSLEFSILREHANPLRHHVIVVEVLIKTVKVHGLWIQVARGGVLASFHSAVVRAQ